MEAVWLACEPLDMGTGFDVMEEKSHPFYPDLPVQVQRNRLLLLGIMLASGFRAIDTEWWHYELPDADNYPLLEDNQTSFSSNSTT